ncbi:MAG: T9SS type A sorting domain-containing protein [Bacteroidota bacterium]
MNKKALLASFFFLAFAGLISAQATFSMVSNPAIVPSESAVQDIPAEMTITNLENVTKTIRWTRNVVSLTGDCQTQVCDPNLCWLPTVSTKTFQLAPNQVSTFIIHLNNPSQVQCCAIVDLHLANVNVPTDSLTARFVYDCATGTKDLIQVSNIVLFPNPTATDFTLTNAENATALRIYAADGREVAYFQATPDQHYRLPEQPNGVYYIVLENKDGQKFRAIQLQKE